MVEALWNEYQNWGSAFYVPVPANVEVLGCDPYLWTPGHPDYGTPPLTPDDNQAMLAKFFLEVGRIVEGDPALGFPGAVGIARSRGLALLLVGQAFGEPGLPPGAWTQAPSASQLGWWMSLATRAQAALGNTCALAFFTYRAGLTGQIGLADLELAPQRTRLQDLYRYNAAAL